MSAAVEEQRPDGETFRARARAAAVRFCCEPQSPAPLGVFRLLMAGFALFQAILWYRDWSAFFGPDAWVQWEISRALGLEWQLHMMHVAGFLKHFGFSPDQSVTIFYWTYVTFLVALLLGWHTRIAAFLVCLSHYVMMNTISIFVYGVDIFLQIALFYLLVMPVAKAYSLDVWQGRVSSSPSWGVTLSRRVLQIHLCLAYISSGFEKVQSPAWWSGNVIWRSLVQPDFRQYDFIWMARFPWLAMLSSWFTMVIESGYCFAMWVPRLRVLWMAGIIILHAGIAFFMGLGLFGLIMVLLTISAFGYEAWTDVKDSMRRVSVRFQRAARA
ncbi:MAG TPA: HTTM domain-containing protein [Chthoniobacterales bacterium]|nr:HTTM domain-containing protein [Chthoniobacterales bacterium]